MKIPKLGDLIEIKTTQGLGYAHYTNQHPEWNAVLRVFDGVREIRPTDWDATARSPVRFIVFFPLRAAVRQKAVAIAGHAVIPPENREFPLFRAGNRDEHGAVYRWFLWDGSREYPANLPAAEVRRLSDWRLVDSLSLAELIESKWSPEIEWDLRNRSNLQ